MNCNKIIVEYLEKNGFDGVFSRCGECACTADDFAPCEGVILDCETGYKQDFTRGGEDYIIGPNKPDGTKKPCPECGQARKFENDIFESPCSYCGEK